MTDPVYLEESHLATVRCAFIAAAGEVDSPRGSTGGRGATAGSLTPPHTSLRLVTPRYLVTLTSHLATPPHTSLRLVTPQAAEAAGQRLVELSAQGSLLPWASLALVYKAYGAAACPLPT
jgi:hypothetical protein